MTGVTTTGAAGTSPRRSPLVKGFLTLERGLNLVVTAAACACLVGAASSGMYQVITRFVFEQPSVWSETLSRTLLIWMVFLGIMTAFRQGAMVSVDLALRTSKGAVNIALRALVALSCILLLAIVVWFGYQMTLRVQYQNLAGLEISIAWAYAALPIGAAFTILAVVAHWIDPEHNELENAQ